MTEDEMVGWHHRFNGHDLVTEQQQEFLYFRPPSGDRADITADVPRSPLPVSSPTSKTSWLLSEGSTSFRNA